MKRCFISDSIVPYRQFYVSHLCQALDDELNQHWEVLAEAIQTVLCAQGNDQAYEQLKTFTRGNVITADNVRDFINRLTLDNSTKQRLLELTPHNYIGLAATLTKQ